MEQRNQELCLDKKEVVSLLEKLLSLVMASGSEDENTKVEHIRELKIQLDDLYTTSGLDKKQLVEKWIQVSGSFAFDTLKSYSTESFYKILPVIFKSSSEYLQGTGDYLYLIAELTIAVDWYLYQGIDLGTE